MCKHEQSRSLPHINVMLSYTPSKSYGVRGAFALEGTHSSWTLWTVLKALSKLFGSGGDSSSML